MNLLLVDQKNVGTHAHGEESPNELEVAMGLIQKCLLFLFANETSNVIPDKSKTQLWMLASSPCENPFTADIYFPALNILWFRMVILNELEQYDRKWCTWYLHHEIPLKKLLNPLTFCMQCTRMESANHFHIWLSRLDELWRCPTSSPAYEGSMWNHSSSKGLTFSQLLWNIR